jgi:glutathione synthase
MGSQRLVAVQMDPLEHINIEGDSTFALMLEAQARGHSLFVYEVGSLALGEGVPKAGQHRPATRQRAHAACFRPARKRQPRDLW